ncbi:MAG: TIGR03089 family protein [Nocardioidaceae bacterium]
MSDRLVTLPAALATALKTDPGRPLITFYDATTGERIELSVKTFDNWVSKIANLLSDDLGLEPGETVAVELPSHWLAPVTLVGIWAAGLRVGLPGNGWTPPASTARVVGPEAVTKVERDPSPLHSQRSGLVIACSLLPLGRPFPKELPVGWLDFAREVPGQPDILLTSSAASSGDMAVETAEQALTHEELSGRGMERSGALGLRPGSRLITDADITQLDGLVDVVAAPLVTGSSVVLVVGADDATRTRIAEQEKATCSAWAPR